MKKIFILVQIYFIAIQKHLFAIQKYLLQYKNIYCNTKIFIGIQKYFTVLR